MDAKLLGRFGEAQAAEFLRGKGYALLAMNYRTRHGEIDLIARDRRFLVFAEVKLRRSAAFAEAREFVTARKQQRLILAAQSYLQSEPTGLQPRFDVIEIYAPDGVAGAVTVRHWENAFGLD